MPYMLEEEKLFEYYLYYCETNKVKPLEKSVFFATMCKGLYYLLSGTIKEQEQLKSDQTHILKFPIQPNVRCTIIPEPNGFIDIGYSQEDEELVPEDDSKETSVNPLIQF